MNAAVLAKRVARGAELPTQLAHVGGVLHVARLHVFDHVTLVGFSVAAVQAHPAGDLLSRERDWRTWFLQPFDCLNLILVPLKHAYIVLRYRSYEANMLKDELVLLT